MPEPGLRWGIAGYGDIVRRKALPALLSLGETVACVWGRDAARAQATCEESGISRDGSSGAFGTSDYTALLDVAEVVYVATPVAAHLPLAIAAARAGLPVLVEKPLGGTAPGRDPRGPVPASATAHAEDAYPRGTVPGRATGRDPRGPVPASATAHAEDAYPRGTVPGRATGRDPRGPVPASATAHTGDAYHRGTVAELATAHAGVAYYRRLAPALGRVREILRGRAVHHATVEFRSHFDPGPDDPRLWRTDPAISGGGVLADIGSHRLDLLCWLLGEAVVTGARTGLPFDLGAERLAGVELAWPSGGTAALEAAWTPGARQDRFRLSFEGGHLELDPLDSGTVRGIVDGAAVEEFLPPPENPHLPLMADFARSVREGTEPVCPVGDAEVVDRLIADAYAFATRLEEHP
ncbi:Gfo/Idh/MocA family protein [Streptosporangium vulgare]|uniref:Gfo/Idh/MocA family protein n=1 Tax=Streptosporangium vulgare TaxID=46190 RepID=A0ABV5TBN8_9ACTN